MAKQSIRFIGDIHGTFNRREYHQLLEDCEKSIQVGDMGLGFSKNDDVSMFKDVDRSKHFFIRGNHDDPKVCQAQVNHIDSGQSDDHGIFFVNGGWSIDGPGAPWCPSYSDPMRTPRRTEGRNWWSDEQHTQEELNELIEEYIDCKPEYVVSHEGPFTATDGMFNPFERYVSRTAQALEDMYRAHQPKLWLFGHWHRPRDVISGNTRFICLAECGYKDLEI